MQPNDCSGWLSCPVHRICRIQMASSYCAAFSRCLSLGRCARSANLAVSRSRPGVPSRRGSRLMAQAASSAQALKFEGKGEPLDALKVTDVPLQECEGAQVHVRMLASPVNPRCASRNDSLCYATRVAFICSLSATLCCALQHIHGYSELRMHVSDALVPLLAATSTRCKVSTLCSRRTAWEATRAWAKSWRQGQTCRT